MCMEMVSRLSHLSDERQQRVWLLESDMTQTETLEVADIKLGAEETLPTQYSLVILGLRTIHLFDDNERNHIFTLARNNLQQGGVLVLHYSDLAVPQRNHLGPWSQNTLSNLEP